jgi:hypothetical protein
MIWSVTLWLLLVFILALWLPQNVIHEGSHALTAKILGAEDVKLYPYPKFEDGKLKHFAWMTYRFDKAQEEWVYSTISIAPQVANVFIVILCTTLLLLVSMPTVLFTFLLALAITNFIDVIVNTSSVYRKEPVFNDVWKFIIINKLEPKYFRIGLVLFAVAFLLVLFLP